MVERMIPDFECWWSGVWLKVAKIGTCKAYVRARKNGATAEELLDGRDRYKANKPAWQAWCHPQTWINGGRWMDEYPMTAASTAYQWVCPHNPTCHSRQWCESGARDARDAMR